MNPLPEWRQIYMAENRRQFPRVDTDKKVTVVTEPPENSDLEGSISDIGQGGTKLFLPQPLELKSKIRIFGMRYDHAAVTAMVKWVKKNSDTQFEIGVQFLVQNEVDFYSDVIDKDEPTPTPLKRGPSSI